jgi:hypothetical protein
MTYKFLTHVGSYGYSRIDSLWTKDGKIYLTGYLGNYITNNSYQIEDKKIIRVFSPDESLMIMKQRYFYNNGTQWTFN